MLNRIGTYYDRSQSGFKSAWSHLQGYFCAMRVVLLCLVILVSIACSRPDDGGKQDPKGVWRGRIMVDRESQGKELPFIFEVREKNDSLVAYFINGKERIRTENIKYTGDSIYIKMDPYDSEIRAKITKSQLIGVWANYARGMDYKLPFHAHSGETTRFYFDEGPSARVSGRFKVVFGEVEDEEEAIAEFVQNGNQVVGTFLTETGDYRYLEGVLDGERLKMSCFDGAHAFLFEADVKSDDKIRNGRFYSGSHFETIWRASRDNRFKLRKPTSITGLQPGTHRIAFTFKELDGALVTPDAASVCNKVLLIQIMGTWCPNCRDQTAYLKEVYRKFGSDSLEILAVGFEPDQSKPKARGRLKEYKESLDIPYYLAYGGHSSKKKVHLNFPGLEPIKAYPTLVYLDKKGNVVRIHAGFSGPATSQYTKFVSESDSLIKHLIEYNYDETPDSTAVDSSLLSAQYFRSILQG